jgi:hypothetical protein
MLLNLLSAAALVVGVAVGLIPALLLGMLLGLVPRPPLLRSRRPARALPPLERPAPEHAPPVAAPTASAASMASAPSISIPIPVGVEVEPPPPERAGVAAARRRHRGLYDDEYAKQLDHLDALRRTISTRLAVGARPVSDDAPRET